MLFPAPCHPEWPARPGRRGAGCNENVIFIVFCSAGRAFFFLQKLPVMLAANPLSGFYILVAAYPLSGFYILVAAYPLCAFFSGLSAFSLLSFAAAGLAQPSPSSGSSALPPLQRLIRYLCVFSSLSLFCLPFFSLDPSPPRSLTR